MVPTRLIGTYRLNRRKTLIAALSSNDGNLIDFRTE